MMNKTFRRGAMAAAALTLALTGCVVTPVADLGPLGTGATQAPVVNGNIPIINLFDANPKAVTSADQKVTFTVNVTVPNGVPAQYNWTSTLGTLSATTGQVVYWSPAGSDGKIKAGSATVTVVVTANGQTVTGNANILIKEDGSATVNIAPAPAASTAPSASTAPVASVAPSAVPSVDASATPAATAAPSAEPSATATAAATSSAAPSADPSATASTSI